MKFAKKIEAAKAMADSDLKLSTLQTLALQAVPNSRTQMNLQKELDRLYNAGYKIRIPEKYKPKTSASNEKFEVHVAESKSAPVIYNDRAQAEKAKRNAELLGFDMTIKKVKPKKEQKMKKTSPRTTSTQKQKAPRPNPFAGADDIYLTPNKIAVTTTKNTRTKRGFKQTRQTKYYEQNDCNTQLLKKANRNVVRVGRTGNNYRTV